MTEAPHRIGPYTVLQLLGEGGMGTVYLAEQKEPVRRRVALKLVKRGMDSKAVLARFEAERNALSLMDHSSIARVLDAGISAAGQPYFVMEYVKGIPITDYCDQHKLGLRERIDLLQKVCAGVQHAHLKGVMHRDLKPSNVLVTLQDGKPVPKIIDFGLAKAIDHRLVEATLFTEQGVLLGTPEYMSPEQAGLGGLDVDTRTDVYSLGVLLYELLVGDLPFPPQALRQAGFLEMQRVIREDEPPKPSTRVTTLGPSAAGLAALRRVGADELKKRLRGDLDWIVLKALEKDRTRRYETAQELAADLQRHLDVEPVLASPPSLGYRMAKFVRRHRVQCAAAVLVALALVGGAAGTAAGLAEAKEQARRAGDNLRLAEDRARQIEELLAQERAFNAANRVYADVTRLAQAKAAERALYPPWPDKAPAMREWLAHRGEPLLARLPELQAQLADLRHQYLAATPAAARGTLPGGPRWLELTTQMEQESDPEVRQDYRQEINAVEARMGAAAVEAGPADTAHLHRTLAGLVDDLQRFAAGDGPVARVRARLRIAETMVETTIVQPRSAWEQAAAAIAASDGKRAAAAYRGLQVTPQLGLVPCGMDPDSRLWEFVHVPSAVDGQPLVDRDPENGRLRVSPGNGIVFVLLPGGRLPIEDGKKPDPRHAIDLEPFFVSKWEVTRAQWSRLCGTTLDELEAMSAEFWPVVMVDWRQADRVLREAGLALPTELQWEYACRGGTTSRWWTGATLASVAGKEHVGPDTRLRTIGRLQQNPFGLFDLGGNAFEWCLDTAEPYGTERPGDGARPKTLTTDMRVVRGGAAGADAIFSASANGTDDDTTDAWQVRQMFEDAKADNLGIRATRRLVR